MRCRRDTTWLWNTGQDKKFFLSLYLILIYISQVYARPDFIDSMSRQFFGFSDNNEQPQKQQHQSESDPFAQMFETQSQQAPQRSPPQNYRHPNPHQRHPSPYRGHPPQRQGYYAPPHAVPQQLHPPYNGPPPVYGQQQGFGQRQPNSNETKTVGYPPDHQKPKILHPAEHPHQEVRHYPPIEYHQPHHHQQVTAVEYHKPPATVVGYQPHHHPPIAEHVEYHHLPPQTAVVSEHQGPGLEIHTGTEHAYHEPPTHVEYHHPPKVEYHHYTTHKPKRFSLSFNQPSPDYKIIDKHLKLPPVKFRFHINPKIVITSNTKDPLDKKHHHDEEHDLEPYPPPDAFSDPNAEPQYNEHTVEHYPVKHHYPVEHHVVEHHAVEYPHAKHPYAVEHHAVEYPQAKHSYPVEHHAVEHHPAPEYTYDLSHGHSHLNPHRSLGHYEPTFKVKTKAMIFTEPPPTRPTTTTTTPRPTTSTARTTTARTTRTTRSTTARTTRRARISARNPGFSVAFTQGSTTATTSPTDVSTASVTTTRRSIFRSSPERERENDGISARRDELSTSAETSSSTQTTSGTTTTPNSTTASTTASTTPMTTTTTTTTPMTTTTTTTVTPITTMTPASTSTTLKPTTTTTTPKPTTTTTTTTEPTTQKSTTVSSTTTISTTTTAPSSQSTSVTPAEETTRRTTTLSLDANEIDMEKSTEPPRRRPEPLQDKSSTVERSESFNFESSESVKVIETTMLIDGKNQTVRFYYITQPVKLPLDVFQKMTGQGRGSSSGVNVIKIRDKRFASGVSSVSNQEQSSYGL